MNDQKILELMAATPGMRRVQLADKLDMATDDVQALLAGLMAVGDVVESDGFGPNGLPCKLYNLSDRFKASAAYAPLAAKAAAAGFQCAPGLNRIERSIAFIRSNGGTATSSELHAMLGLAPDEYVSSMLASAVRTSRLVKDGKNWTLGTGPGTAPPQRVVRDDPDAPAALALPVVSKTPAVAPEPAAPAPVEVVEPAAPVVDVAPAAPNPEPEPEPEPAAQESAAEEPVRKPHPEFDHALSIIARRSQRSAGKPQPDRASAADDFAPPPSPEKLFSPADGEGLRVPVVPEHLCADPAGVSASSSASQVDPSSALPSAPAGDRPYDYPQHPASTLFVEPKAPAVDDNLASSDLRAPDAPADRRDPVFELKYPASSFAGLPPPAVEPPPAVIRVGIWSDGLVEIQRNGRTSGTLFRAEAEALADHILSLRGGAA